VAFCAPTCATAVRAESLIVAPPSFMYFLPQTRSVSALVHKAMRLAHDLAHGVRGKRHLARLAILLICGALGRSASVQADDLGPSRAPPSEALEHYNRGRAHYQAGRYREAVVELERALKLDPGSPNLVYNLARVHELLGDIEQSIGYYERYRNMLPPSESEERQRVAGAIERLRGAKQHVVRPSEEPGSPLVVRMERGVADGAFWTLATFSLAALAAGAATGALALREERQSRDFVLGVDGSDNERRDSAVRADRLAAASDGSLAVGGVGALTSILLYSLRSKPVVQPGLALGQHGWSFTLRGEL